MTYYDFDELVGELTPEQRARVDALKEEARAEIVAYTLRELRKHRNLTQTELARRLDRAQASVSAMETAADNLVSTLRMAVEGMGGHLEVTAVFDNERIPLTTPMRPEGEEGDGGAAAAQDAAEESAPQLERISRVNPQRPTDRREAVAAAKRTVTAARRRKKAAG